MSTPVQLPDGKQVAIDLLQAALGTDALVVGELPEPAAFDQALADRGGIVRVLRIGGTANLRGWSLAEESDQPRRLAVPPMRRTRTMPPRSASAWSKAAGSGSSPTTRASVPRAACSRSMATCLPSGSWTGVDTGYALPLVDALAGGGVFWAP
ncbi:hypothetical protein PV435_48510, partial [Streptomyces scabiei]|nr:hypothetical protein [Streptomyces scabiei]